MAFLNGDPVALDILLSASTVVDIWRAGPPDEILELPYVTYSNDEVDGYYVEALAWVRRDAIVLVMPLHPEDRVELDDARRMYA